MAHNLTSAEIRKMYDFLYKFEKKIKDTQQKDAVVIPNLDVFCQTNDIYNNCNNKSNRVEANKHQGYFLYREFSQQNGVYHFIRHIRNAIAHGSVIYKEKEKAIYLNDKTRGMCGKIPKSLIVPLFKLLYTMN